MRIQRLEKLFHASSLSKGCQQVKGKKGKSSFCAGWEIQNSLRAPALAGETFSTISLEGWNGINSLHPFNDFEDLMRLRKKYTL
jgi:hypothetical protein